MAIFEKKLHSKIPIIVFSKTAAVLYGRSMARFSAVEQPSRIKVIFSRWEEMAGKSLGQVR